MKSNGKQPDQGKDYKSLYENLKRESMENNMTLKSLSSQNATLSHSKERLIQELEHIRETSHEELTNLKFHVSILEDRNKELIIERREMEIKLDNLRINNETLMQQYQIYRNSQEQEYEEMRKKYAEERKEFQSTYNEYTNAIDQHKRLVSENGSLQANLVKEQEKFKSDLADKQRQKMQVLDAMKKQMMNKACEMRNKALEIRREQLDTSTRITFLQNDQLIREIEYQSSQTEKILNKNTELQKLVKELTRKIQIHEVVEKQIARRNVIARGLIKKYAERDDNEGKQDEANQNQQDSASENPSQVMMHGKSRPKRISRYSRPEQVKVQQVFIEELENRINSLTEENQQMKNVNEQLKKEKLSLQQRFKMESTNVLNLLVHYYQKLVELKQDSSETDWEFEKLKEHKVEEWPEQSVRKTVRIILEAIRPYIGLKLLRHPYFAEKQKKNSIDLETLKENKNVSKYLEALKRRNHRSLCEKTKGNSEQIETEKENIKQDIIPKTKSFKTLESVAKRFLKPNYRGRI